MSYAMMLEPVRARLDRLRSAIRTLYVREGVARLLLGVVAFVLVTFLLDYTLNLPAGVRLVLLAGGLGAAGVFLFKDVFYRLKVPISDDDLAQFVERHHPDLHDRLISAIVFSRTTDFDPEFNSPELVGTLVSEAREVSEQIDFQGVLVPDTVKRRIRRAGAALGVVAILALLFTEYAGVYVQRAFGANVRWPQRIRLAVLGEGWKDNVLAVARGEELTIEVRAERLRAGVSLPSSATITYAFEDDEERGTEEMWGFGEDRFRYKFSSLTSSFRFRVKAGDDETDEYIVKVLNPPALERIHLFLEMPAYLQRPKTPDDRPETNGNLTVPLHTRVRFTAWSTSDLESARLDLGRPGKQKSEALQVSLEAAGGRRRVDGTFEVVEERSEYQLVFMGENGLSNEKRDPIRFQLIGLNDRAPEILVQDPSGHEDISEICVRPFSLVVKDDFGIKDVAVEYKVSGSKEIPWTAVPFTPDHHGGAAYGATELRSRYEPGLDVGALGVKAGDYVVVRFVASDFKDIGTPNVTRSGEIRLSVIALVELQKRLEQDIEKVKAELVKTKEFEARYLGRVARYREADFGAQDLMTAQEAGQVRDTAQEQSSITSRIERAAQNIERVRRRGVYNRVFDAAAAKDLERAEQELFSLTGSSQEPGPSPVSAELLREASKMRVREPRQERLAEAHRLQGEVVAGIEAAIRFLDRWSTYQEIIRTTRQIWEQQKGINEGLKEPKKK